MTVFKEEYDAKRVIFNLELGVAERLKRAKESAAELGKKLDVDAAVTKAVEKFLDKAEKRIADLNATRQDLASFRISTGPTPVEQIQGYVLEPPQASPESEAPPGRPDGEAPGSAMTARPGQDCKAAPEKPRSQEAGIFAAGNAPSEDTTRTGNTPGGWA